MSINDDQLERILGELASLRPSPDATQRVLARTRAAFWREPVQPKPQKRSFSMALKLSIAAAMAIVLAASSTVILWSINANNGQQRTNIPNPEESGNGARDDGKGLREPLNPEIAKDESRDLNPEWGHLAGTFVVHGNAERAPIFINNDDAYCGGHPLIDESVIVDPKTRGLKNVVVYLHLSRGDEVPQEHPSYAATKEERVILDNIGCRFEPHVALLRTGQTLLLKNSDRIGHAVKVDALSKPMSSILAPGATIETQFDKAERSPVPVGCSIHPWMKGYVVIRSSPYMTLTDGEGRFQIDNLPVGKWTFQFWHEKIGYIRNVTVNGKHSQWSRGRLEIEIRPGTNDIGEVAMTIEDES